MIKKTAANNSSLEQLNYLLKREKTARNRYRRGFLKSLAEESGVNYESLRKLANNDKRNPSAETVDALIRALI